MLAAVLLAATGAPGFANVSGGIALSANPTLTMQANAPLTGLLSFSTDVATRASFRVQGVGEAWNVFAHGLQMDHALPVAGLAPGTTYTVDQISLTSDGGATHRLSQSFSVTTNPLPANFPDFTVRTSVPQLMEPGLQIVSVKNVRDPDAQYTFALDAAGVVRWYMPGDAQDIHQLPGGDFLFRMDNIIRKMDVLGNVKRSWHPTIRTAVVPLPGGVPIDSSQFHHDVQQLPDGNLVTLTRKRRMVSDFPSSDTNPNAPPQPALVEYDNIIEFTPDGTIVKSWDMLDILDPSRIGYGVLQPTEPHDWSHGNAVVHDPRDDSLIVSFREQDAVVKFSRETGELKWIIGPHDNWDPRFEQYLLTQIGEPFEWQYHQHAPKLLPNGNILIHDNGNFRASPFDPPLDRRDNYTRAVEFEIDEQAMTIKQVWAYGKDTEEVIYSGAGGDVDWLSTTDNVLITFRQDGRRPRVIEVNRDGRRVFDVELGIGAVYRSERILSLYPSGYTITPIAVPVPTAFAAGIGLMALWALIAARGRRR